MEYRNTRTGVVITVESEINGGDWERVSAPKTPVVDEKLETPKKTTKRAK